MNLAELIEQLQKLKNQTESRSFRLILEHILNLLNEILKKNIPEKKKLNIQNEIGTHLENIQTEQQAKNGFRNLRKSLTKEFGFVSSNYYLTIGIGVGLAIGSGLGIAFGAPFGNAIIYGPTIGSAIGLIGGLIIGRILDKKKESENLILKNL